MKKSAGMDPRLALLCKMAPPCYKAADIGTDHGYLICALVENGKAKRGIAADLKPQPLEKARREAERRGFLPRWTLSSPTASPASPRMGWRW